MQTCTKSFVVILAVLFQFLTVSRLSGMGMEAFGPAEHVGSSGDSPRGVAPVLKHRSRVYWRDVNGYGLSYYKTDIEQTNELIKLFSEAKFKRHIVMLRLGSGETKTFAGKAVPYTVKFDLPAGLFVHHAKQYAKTGVYTTEPSLVIHIDKDWIDQLDKLVIPPSVKLYRSPYELERLIEAAKTSDRSTRCRALVHIGEAAIDTAETRELLEACSNEDDQYIKRDANNAIGNLDAQKKLDEKLRAQFSEYFENHPQRHRVPTPEEVFKKIKETEQEYATEGFTARGTLFNHKGNLMNWVVTMGNDRLVVREFAVDKEAIGRIEHTIFVSPDDMVTIQRSQYWYDGKLIKSKPFKSVEPVGNTYDILIGRILWPLGRSFARRIDRVESVREQSDGMLNVVAFGEDNLGIRWELKIDPMANYLVRSAKGFKARRGPGAEAKYIVTAAGVFGQEGRFTNHTAHWQEGERSEPVSMAVNEVSAKPDLNLIIDLEEEIAGKDK